MNWRKRLNLPREHGAWAMLYVPFVLGAMVAGEFSLRLVLLWLAITALFISRESLLMWWRARQRNRSAHEASRWLLAYFGIAAVCGTTLWWNYRLVWLAPLGLVGLLLLALNGQQGAQLAERSLRNELLAVMGLTLTAPAAHYVGTQQWSATTWWLWALSGSYFASSVFYLKLRLASAHAKSVSQRQQSWQHCLSYHLFLLLALAGLSVTGSLPLFAGLAFLPILTRAFWSLHLTPTSLNLKQIGMLELVYSLIFLTGVVIMY